MGSKTLRTDDLIFIQPSPHPVLELEDSHFGISTGIMVQEDNMGGKMENGEASVYTLYLWIRFKLIDRGIL